MTVVGEEEPREAAELAPTGAAAAEAPVVNILFVLRSLRQLRYVQSTLELLVRRGHAVHMLLEYSNHGDAEQSWLEEMLKHPNFGLELTLNYRRDVLHKRAVAVRAGMEYLQFLEPGYAEKPRYVQNVLSRRRQPPRVVKALSRIPIIRSPRGLGSVNVALSALERAVAAPTHAIRVIERLHPDIVVLGDAGSRASVYLAFLRAARRLGVPTASCVLSWDNLTTRPRIRSAPDLLVVWNETQREEAVEIHGVPVERVVVTGAANFDHWFAWQPRAREAFLARVGLDSKKPVVLWVGSALNSWEPPEVAFIERWVRALRESSDETLREAGILLRPHPLRITDWSTSRFGHENVAVWPNENLTMPIGTEQKSEFYDSIFHSAAVIGINTSAMIEASIISRPVFTILDPDYHDSQLGALHFSYLLESSGGALRLAQSLEEHTEDLAAVLAGRKPDASESARRFVAHFVRPGGIDRAAAPIVVESLERLAATRVAPEPDPRWVPPLRAAIVFVLFVADRLRRLRPSRRRARKLVKPIRRLVVLILPARIRLRLRLLRPRTDSVEQPDF